MKIKTQTQLLPVRETKPPKHTHDPHSTTDSTAFLHVCSVTISPLFCFVLFSLKKKINGVACPLTDSFTDFTSTELTRVGESQFFLP